MVSVQNPDVRIEQTFCTLFGPTKDLIN